MRCQIEAKALVDICTRARAAISGSRTVPAHGAARLVADSNTLTVNTFDGAMWGRFHTTAAVSNGGAAAVRSDDALAAAKAMQGVVTLRSDSTHVCLTGSAGAIRLPLHADHEVAAPPAPQANIEVPNGVAALRESAVFVVDDQRGGITLTEFGAMALGSGTAVRSSLCSVVQRVAIPAAFLARIGKMDRLFLGDTAWRAEAEWGEIAGPLLAEPSPVEWARLTTGAVPGFSVSAPDMRSAIAGATLGRASTVVLSHDGSGEAHVSAEDWTGAAASTEVALPIGSAPAFLAALSAKQCERALSQMGAREVSVRFAHTALIFECGTVEAATGYMRHRRQMLPQQAEVAA